MRKEPSAIIAWTYEVNGKHAEEKRTPVGRPDFKSDERC